jgi:CDP-glucose 4,6-dehydratase
MESVYADIRDGAHLQTVISTFRPQVVFHLAAQSLVRKSYAAPVETYEVNVMGTVHLLEALRRTQCCRSIVNVTSDKCYENKEWHWGYRENDELGGYDPYSSSKGCAELVTAAYRRSFFEAATESTGLASARAGNVIGGGDFSADRIVPDFMAATRSRKPLRLRNPNAVRPWQHVLEPLCGYLILAERLWSQPEQFAQSWNFGPTADGIRPVSWIVQKMNDYSGQHVDSQTDDSPQPHEARLLMLDSMKARLMLGWKSRWTLEQALQAVVSWYFAAEQGKRPRQATLEQIAAYENSD